MSLCLSKLTRRGDHLEGLGCCWRGDVDADAWMRRVHRRLDEQIVSATLRLTCLFNPGLLSTVPSEPAEDERYVSEKRLSTTARAGSASAVWVCKQRGRRKQERRQAYRYG